MKNILVVIPARGGSVEIPRKNLKEFCGQPLVFWSINSAMEFKRNSQHNVHVAVSSDDEEILRFSKDHECIAIERPDYISGSDAPIEQAVLHALDFTKLSYYDAVVILQPTSPIRKNDDIQNAVDFFFERKYDSLFSSVPAKDTFIWRKNEKEQMFSLTYNYRMRQNRQDIKEMFTENGSIYVCRPRVLQRFNNRLGEDIGTYTMESWQEIELDSEFQWIIASEIMRRYLPDVIAGIPKDSGFRNVCIYGAGTNKIETIIAFRKMFKDISLKGAKQLIDLAENSCVCLGEKDKWTAGELKVYFENLGCRVELTKC